MPRKALIDRERCSEHVPVGHMGFIYLLEEIPNWRQADDLFNMDSRNKDDLGVKEIFKK